MKLTIKVAIYRDGPLSGNLFKASARFEGRKWRGLGHTYREAVGDLMIAIASKQPGSLTILLPP